MSNLESIKDLVENGLDGVFREAIDKLVEESERDGDGDKDGIEVE